jgi:hypothetical protein
MVEAKAQEAGFELSSDPEAETVFETAAFDGPVTFSGAA